jgi:hypothetical protein
MGLTAPICSTKACVRRYAVSRLRDIHALRDLVSMAYSFDVLTEKLQAFL